MDEALRKQFERCGLIGPTVLGFCSAGTCVRPDNRGICANCRYLVPHLWTDFVPPSNGRNIDRSSNMLFKAIFRLQKGTYLLSGCDILELFTGSGYHPKKAQGWLKDQHQLRFFVATPMKMKHGDRNSKPT